MPPACRAAYLSKARSPDQRAALALGPLNCHPKRGTWAVRPTFADSELMNADADLIAARLLPEVKTTGKKPSLGVGDLFQLRLNDCFLAPVLFAIAPGQMPSA